MRIIDEKILATEVFNHLLLNTIDIMKLVKRELGMESELVQDIWDPKDQKLDRKIFPFFGSGCGFAWIEYDKRNHDAKNLVACRGWRDGIEEYKQYILRSEFTPEMRQYYRQVGFPLEATLSQNMMINTKILEVVVDYFKSKYKISKMWVQSRLD